MYRTLFGVAAIVATVSHLCCLSGEDPILVVVLLCSTLFSCAGAGCIGSSLPFSRRVSEQGSWAGS